MTGELYTEIMYRAHPVAGTLRDNHQDKKWMPYIEVFATMHA